MCTMKMLECCVCFLENGSKLACNHAICESCLIRWREMSNTCPICRETIIVPPKLSFVCTKVLIFTLFLLDWLTAHVDFLRDPRFGRSRLEFIACSAFFSVAIILCTLLSISNSKLRSFLFPILKLLITVFYFAYEHFDHSSPTLIFVFVLRGFSAVAGCFAFPVFYAVAPESVLNFPSAFQRF